MKNILFILSIIAVITSCSKENKKQVTPVATYTRDTFVYYKQPAQSTAVPVAELYKAKKGVTIYFYGNTDATGAISKINAMAVSKKNSDTIYNLTFDDNSRASVSFVSIGGAKDTTLLHYTYQDTILTVTRYSIDWTTNAVKIRQMTEVNMNSYDMLSNIYFKTTMGGSLAGVTMGGAAIIGGILFSLPVAAGGVAIWFWDVMDENRKNATPAEVKQIIEEANIERDAIIGRSDPLNTTPQPNNVPINPWQITNGINLEAYHIGDEALGGIIFYLDNTGRHGLVAALTDQSTAAVWGCNGSNVAGTGSVMGSGAGNTANIVAHCPGANVAARICDNLVLEGYNDWYLPSQYEVYWMYYYLYRLGRGNLSNKDYWSSTQSTGNSGGQELLAWAYNFAGVDGWDNPKNALASVRAIRSF